MGDLVFGRHVDPLAKTCTRSRAGGLGAFLDNPDESHTSSYIKQNRFPSLIKEVKPGTNHVWCMNAVWRPKRLVLLSINHSWNQDRVTVCNSSRLRDIWLCALTENPSKICRRGVVPACLQFICGAVPSSLHAQMRCPLCAASLPLSKSSDRPDHC